MNILKNIIGIPAVAVAALAILAVSLVVITVGVIGAYVGWAVGVPVNANINGEKRRYRWLNRIA